MSQSASTQIMIYMSAQNELSGKARDNIVSIQNCTDLDDICTYIMLDKVDDPNAPGRDERNTVQYLLRPGAGKADFDPKGFSVDDKDVSSPLVFEIILRAAREHFKTHSTLGPPRQKMLIFWGHGGGMKMLDEQKKAGVARAQANMKAFADVLARKSKADKSNEFDIVAFDSCYMCMIETMHQLRDVCDFALCSSTAVEADGFPYENIFRELKASGHTFGPTTTAKRVSEIYDAHYLNLYPHGDRFLFVCQTKKTLACITALNELGKTLTSLLSKTNQEDPVRKAVIDALTSAHVNSAYVYVLQFLEMLPIMLEELVTAALLDTAQLESVKKQSRTLQQAVDDAFQGNRKDAPISPQIWAPFQINSFIANESTYNALDSSDFGKAGWATFWRTFHRREMLVNESPDNHFKATLGLPTNSQLGH
jgi:Clostripain family